MSRLQVPLRDRKLWLTGDVLLWAELWLLVRGASKQWRRLRFRYDSGSEITTMSAALAEQIGIPYPRHPFPGLAVTTPTGTFNEVRAGAIKMQVLGMGGTEYWIPCFFLGDPNAPLYQGKPSVGPRSLLGLSGVVDKLRIAIDGAPTPGAAYGNVIVETIVP